MSTIKLESSDGMVFEVSKEVAQMSATINNMLEDLHQDSADVPIPITAINGKILGKVIEWAEYHHADPQPPPDEPKNEKGTTPDPATAAGHEIGERDRQFCDVDQPTLFELLMAANYLDMKPLLDLTCKTVANMIIGKTPEEIRRTFNIKNDLTPEEEKAIRKELGWSVEETNKDDENDS